MKKISMRRKMVSSSLNEIFTDQLGKGVGWGGGIPPPHFYSRLLDRYLKTT
jgi:hypothetical protein